MKLNLVPTHVAKEKASGGAIFVMFLLILVGILGAVFMVVSSAHALDQAKQEETDALNQAADAKAISDRADALMADSGTHTLVRNVALAQAMEKHSSAYPDLYDTLRRYIPSYFRVTSMAASPGGADTCIVTLTGTVTTYQQYADLGLAFMRIPGAQSYSPSGYEITDAYVPNLTDQDMTGRRIHPGDQNVPDDEQARLQYLVSQGTLTTYTGAGGFGDDTVTTKGAMPNASLVTITITLQSDLKHHYDLQTPDPRQTLALGVSTAATSSGAPAGFGPPGVPGAAGTAGAGAPPTGNPPAASGTAGKDNSD